MWTGPYQGKPKSLCYLRWKENMVPLPLFCTEAKWIDGWTLAVGSIPVTSEGNRLAKKCRVSHGGTQMCVFQHFTAATLSPASAAWGSHLILPNGRAGLAEEQKQGEIYVIWAPNLTQVFSCVSYCWKSQVNELSSWVIFWNSRLLWKINTMAALCPRD